MSIDVAAVIVEANKFSTPVGDPNKWVFDAVVVSILSDTPSFPADAEVWVSVLSVIGSRVKGIYAGTHLPKMAFRPGIVFRMEFSDDVVSMLLEQHIAGQKPEVHLQPDIIRPMNEPCVRVPLSLLHELRGQEYAADASRKAIIQAWSERGSGGS